MQRLSQFVGVLILLSSMASAQQGFRGKVQLTGAATVKVTGHAVSLSWVASPNASTYNVYRATTSGGPYQQIVSAITTTTAVDQNAAHGVTYYYAITAVNQGGESGKSNEVRAVIP